MAVILSFVFGFGEAYALEMLAGLLILEIIFLVVFILWAGSLLFHLFSSLRKTRAPFVPAPRRAIKYLASIMELQPDSFVYDLGCGDGRVLRALRRHYPNSKYIGLENDLLPYLLGRLASLHINPGNFRLKRQNFFKSDISGATHVFLYLFPEVMEQLLPKLQSELKPGTQLFSLDFQFSRKEPIEIFSVPELKKHKMFLYKF